MLSCRIADLQPRARGGRGADGRRLVERCLVEGDDESDRFSAADERQLAIVDELLAEGQAAYLAGAQDHAGWTLKGVDIVLARAKLALAIFENGRDGWEAELATPRPEYEPRYSIAPDKPVGW